MEIFTYMIQGFSDIVQIGPLVAIVLGVITGVAVGAMPGLSPAMGVALLLPFTFQLPPLIGLVLLCSVYLASNYGGSITAIAINTPGTPSAVVTAFDGYPLNRMGKTGIAMGHSLVSSVVGGIIGIIILIIFAQPLAMVAIQMHPAEYFALAVFGLTTVASLGGDHWGKAFLAALFGLLITTVGIDPIGGVRRYTFGVRFLFDGFALIPALIGLFALSELFMKLEYDMKGNSDVTIEDRSANDRWPSIKEYWAVKRTTVQSAVMGTLIGIFPGAGSAIASFISYDFAKRTSKNSESFGKGQPEGVAAAEAANSASVGGALVPLLTLGIPGSAATAVLIGALLIHDLVPGPQLFRDSPDIVYGIFASLLIANIAILFVGFGGSKLWMQVIKLKPAILTPIILTVSFIGSFSVQNSMFDVAACFGFGILGWILRRYKFPVSPIVLGMVLGTLAEENFRRAVLMGGYSVFFTRPATLILLFLSVASFAVPFIQQRRRKRKMANTKS